MCDRPGCYEPPRESPHVAARYCAGECSGAMRRVLDRERKYRCRRSKAGRLKRSFEYEAAREKRRQRRAAGDRDNARSRRGLPSPPTVAVGFSGERAGTTLPSAHSREVPTHDSQTTPGLRPRAPPAP